MRKQTSLFKEEALLKRCFRCNKAKSLPEFHKDKTTKDGYQYRCKECQKAIMKAYYHTEKGSNTRRKYYQISRINAAKRRKKASFNRFARKAIPVLKARATKRGINFDISVEDLCEWWLSTEDRCYHCKIKISEFITLKSIVAKYKGKNYEIKKYKKIFCADKKTKSRWMTIDRLDSDRGYEIGNIVKSCWLCNYVKGTYLASEDMNMIGEQIISRLQSEILKESKRTGK